MYLKDFRVICVSSMLVRIPRMNRIDLDASRVKLGFQELKKNLPPLALAAAVEV